ncbi:MAG: hypothetical protein EOR00_33445 [Mesorhizobium sp.]|uniref:hypothetical protein n=1 Tax=Mesorhizobium sp. TaxID=1871066 RepID=UPI000FE89ACA|nr:hypothetical protein [Mesorhizobium sp.]RWP07653.1 MAG: hypothetical protein EOR00_33445 [Mesorhizobium sp.]
MTVPFSPRAFLRGRQALLVHFSTVMARRPELTFPDDLRRAATLQGVPLAFSTIQRGDTNPNGTGRGGAEGSVGMLVDIGPGTIIKSVSHQDSGSNEQGSLGFEPTEENCASSIDQRVTSNEWHVQDYLPVGLFILPPIFVRRMVDIGGALTPVEVRLQVPETVEPFPGVRVFSANAEKFLELDRPSGEWRAVSYDEIIPPR